MYKRQDDWVRKIAAKADLDAGRDLAWVRTDESEWVRKIAGEI